MLVHSRLSKAIHRRTQVGGYNDKMILILAEDSGAADEYGHPVLTETSVPASCSFTDAFKNRNQIEKWTAYADITEIVAEVRFTTPTPTKGSRVTITHRQQEAIAELTYEIAAIQDRGLFGFLCALKKVSL